MPLYLVGAGPSIDYLSLKAVSLLKRADKVYVDVYTSIAPGVTPDRVAEVAGGEVVAASRSMLEELSSRIIEEASGSTVVVLVPGDPLYATTHVSLVLEARRRGVEAHVVPGVSGLQAVIDATGLQVYKFCRPITLVYPEGGYKPYSVVETIWDNMERGLHTLVLLDLRLDEGKAMTIPEAVELLLKLEKELAEEESRSPILSSSIMVGVARAGLAEQTCVAGTPGYVASARYPPPPHSLVVVGRLHPLEAEALSLLCGCRVCG